MTEFGVKFGVDIISVSFTRKRDEIDYVRDLLERTDGLADKRHMQVFAKIENLEGLNNYEEILAAADGIIISRSDLEQELSSDKMFLAQKWMIERSNLAAKPVIISGMLLESMGEREKPDWRECEDISIAVSDGVDCVLLSDLASNGKYGIESLNTIGVCCAEAERVINPKVILENYKAVTSRMAPSDDNLASSAINSVTNVENEIELIICVTKTGNLARLLSKYRPSVPVLTFSNDDVVLR